MAGKAWRGRRGIPLLAIFLVVTSAIMPVTARSSSSAPVYPLKVSSNGRYLVDQNNEPFLLVGDSPQALIDNLSLSEADTYFADRQKNGFNAVWINLLCDTYTGGRADGSTYDGILPFTTPGDLSTPNPAYFSRVDAVINLAAKYGLVVFLDPIETGGWLSTLRSNGTTRAYNYGLYLGNRYKGFPNIVWMSGNDFQSWQNTSDDAVVQAVARGIHAADPDHLQTVELNYLSSGSQDDPTWTPLINLDAAYTYYPTYAQVLAEYNRSTTMPTFMVEGHYDGENVGGELGTPNVLRRQEYWTMLSGAAGQLYGNQYWGLQSGWQQGIDTVGVQQLQYMTTLFQDRPWYDLVPDQNHQLVTAGYGTFASSGNVSESDYVTAARTPNGSLAIAYLPTVRTITVDLNQLSGPVTARWYDPTNGSYHAIAGSPFPNTGAQQFTPAGSNAAGEGDWALVLEAGSVPPPATPTPTGASSAPLPGHVQGTSQTPQSSPSTVSASFTSAETAGDTNVVAIGWNDMTASIRSITDSAGNSYRVAAPTTRGNGMSQAIYYASGITGGTDTVTATFDQGAAMPDLRLTEYRNLDPVAPVDAVASGSGSATTASSGGATTTTGNELLFAAGMTTGTFTGAGTGFTTRMLTAPDGDIAEDMVASSPGSYAAAASVTSPWLMQLVALLPAPVTHVSQGWNLLSLPLQTGGAISASGLLSSLNGAGQLGSGAISTLAAHANGRFSVYIPGYSADQSLDPAQGIFALSARSGLWTPRGTPYTSGQPVRLQQGWNLVAAPYPSQGLKTSSVAGQIDPTCSSGSCSVKEIAMYSGGSYQTYMPGTGGADLTVPATAGMWIEMSAATTWTPHP